MLVAVAVAWVAALVWRAWWPAMRHGVPLTCATVVMVTGMLLVTIVARIAWPHCSRYVATLLLALSVALTVGVSTGVHALMHMVDPLPGMMNVAVPVRVMVSAPVLQSDRRGFECRVDASMRAVRLADGWHGSYGRVRVYASGVSCALVRSGAVLQTSVRVEQARYGTRDIWLSHEMAERPIEIQAPHAVHQTVERMHDAFFTVCADLSDQGRVLVPGLTLGVLGQDAMYGMSYGGLQSVGVDDSYAQALQDAFASAGIMHLMAVSGGHFALVGALARHCCAWMLAPRRVRVVVTAVAYGMLYAVLYPSDSVLRALVMGLLGCGPIWLGRRQQTVGSLSWTVLAVLIVDPSMAASYGFALSCAAVAGIALGTGPLCVALGHGMPRPVASALAATVCAQAAAMPIQVLMTGSVPLWSIPANLMVSWIVDAATVCGLLALLVSWAAPHAGFALAWLSSCGTRVMERTAMTLGTLSSAQASWMAGVPGALVMALCELLVVGMLLLASAAWRIAGRPVDEFGARPARMGLRDRFRVWRDESRKLLADMRWRMP